MRVGDNFQDGKTVTFECKKNYDLLGNASVRCNGGVWNSDTPKCKGNYERKNNNNKKSKQGKTKQTSTVIMPILICQIIEWIYGTYSLFTVWNQVYLGNHTPHIHVLLHLSSLVRNDLRYTIVRKLQIPVRFNCPRPRISV